MTPLDCALGYGSLGYHVFPCAMVGDAKRPMVARWQEAASTDHAQLAEWWTRWPAAMVGLAHRLTGTMALDIDAKHGQPGVLTYLAYRMAGCEEPATPSFRTASGGSQRILARPPALANLAGNYTGTGKDGKPQNLGLGLDVILGYSVLPTVNATPGRVWEHERAPSELPPAGCPDWIAAPILAKLDRDAAIAMLPARTPAPGPAGASLAYVAAAIDGECEAVTGLTEGGRNTGLHRAAANIGRALARAGRVDLETWAADALARAAPWCATRESQATIRSGLTWGVRNG